MADLVDRLTALGPKIEKLIEVGGAGGGIARSLAPRQSLFTRLILDDEMFKTR